MFSKFWREWSEKRRRGGKRRVQPGKRPGIRECHFESDHDGRSVDFNDGERRGKTLSAELWVGRSRKG